jgi:hypothetical protein
MDGSKVGFGVGAGVGIGVGRNVVVGTGVGAGVGVGVGSCVGSADIVGSGDGFGVGAEVGISVGIEVGTGLGAGDGFRVWTIAAIDPASTALTTAARTSLPPRIASVNAAELILLARDTPSSLEVSALGSASMASSVVITANSISQVMSPPDNRLLLEDAVTLNLLILLSSYPVWFAIRVRRAAVSSSPGAPKAVMDRPLNSMMSASRVDGKGVGEDVGTAVGSGVGTGVGGKVGLNVGSDFGKVMCSSVITSSPDDSTATLLQKS